MSVISTIKNTQKREVLDATKPITIQITSKHLEKAVRCNGNRCVIAKAFDDSALGEFYDGIEVGLTVTKISLNNKILRYATPRELHPAIKYFDKTGQWNLSEGFYKFSVLSPSMKLNGRPSRWHKHLENTDGSGRDQMKPRATPTRRITKVGIKKGKNAKNKNQLKLF